MCTIEDAKSIVEYVEDVILQSGLKYLLTIAEVLLEALVELDRVEKVGINSSELM